MTIRRNRNAIAAVIFMVVGVVARWYVILHAGSWWFDEGVGLSQAKLPILSSWQVLRYENNPPLYMWLVHFWGSLFGFGEFPLRFFSFLFGIAAMFAIIWLASELFDIIVGLWAGAIYAVSSLAIFLDTEARMYSLLGLLIALSYIYFLKIIFANRFPKSPRRDIVLYIIITALALYTSVTALWIPITQLVIIALIKPKEVSRFAAVIYIILPILLFSPWLIAFAYEHIALSHSIAAGTWHYFNSGGGWSVVISEPLSFFNYLSASIVTAGSISLLVALVFIGWFMGHTWKRRKLIEYRAVSIVALGLTVPLAISIFTIDLGAPRYYYQSAIFCWIAIAYAIVIILEWAKESKLIPVVVGVIVACYALSNIYFALAYANHGNWDVAAQWIDSQHPDIILAMPKMWSAEVYDPSSTFYFLPPPVPALLRIPLDPLQTVTRYNYNWGSISAIVTTQQKEILQNEIALAVSSSSCIIFGYQGSQAEETILSDLATLGFQPGATFYVNGYLPEELVVFNRG